MTEGKIDCPICKKEFKVELDKIIRYKGGDYLYGGHVTVFMKHMRTKHTEGEITSYFWHLYFRILKKIKEVDESVHEEYKDWEVSDLLYRLTWDEVKNE